MLRVNCLMLAVSIGVSMLLIGCSSSEPPPPEMGTVTGTVTIDGNPVPELLVSFEPQTPGMGGSNGITDAAGDFELTYQSNIKGAVVGVHTVRVTGAAGGGEAGGETGAAQVEIPVSYNTASKLTEEVKSGENTFTIDVKTK